MNKDTVIGITGAVVLLAAMVGIFQYEGAQTESALGGTSFEVTWDETSENGPTTSGATPYEEETQEVLDIQKRNLTAAQFTVLWEAELGQNTLEVTVTPPNASGLEPQTVTGSEGEVKLSFDVPNEVPQDATVFANGEEDARADLDQQFAAERGTGVWTVSVRFADASGPGGLPVGSDEEVNWEARTILTAFEPRLSAN